MTPRDVLEPEFATGIIENALAHWKGRNPLFVRYFENAVYSVDLGEGRAYLRITSAKRRTFEEIVSEIELLNYLEVNSFPSNRSVPSISGSQIVQTEHAEQVYFLVVFTECPGHEIRPMASLDEALIQSCGSVMSKLHNQLAEFQLKHSFTRPNWQDERWPSFHLAVPALEEHAWNLHGELSAWWRNLDYASETQLIHGDFTIRNIRYVGNDISLFDFDGCCTHFAGYEIACFLHHFRTLGDDARSSIASSFFRGYAENRDVSRELLESLPMFCMMKLLRSFQVLYEEIVKGSDLIDALGKRRVELEQPSPWRRAIGV
jgi:Ser/Thr protein kinase RdoA (MazF antagonist)